MAWSVELEVGVKGTRHEELLNALNETANRVIEGTDLEVVELSLRGSSRRRLLRVDIDRPGPRGVDIDDCQRVSVALGDALESGELLDDSYVLEVSSPGLDRPIVTSDDYRRNAGRRVVLRTREPIDGRKEWKGVLKRLENGSVHLEDDDAGEISISVDQIELARQDIEF